MKISPLIIQNNPSFKSVTRSVYKDYNTGKYGSINSDFVPFDKILCYRNYTYFFRQDLKGGWKNLADDIEEQFRDTKKVNVYDFACSDGSEAYSLAISLIERLGKKAAKKYFPIHASDIDEEMIKIVQNYRTDADTKDFNKIDEYTNHNFEKYFYPI